MGRQLGSAGAFRPDQPKVFVFCFFCVVLFVFCAVFVFYFIKISKFALPGVMLMYERTSIDRKKESLIDCVRHKVTGGTLLN